MPAMRFKTDENVHPAAARLLREHGHDAVTFDMGFADIRTYSPDQFQGIVVLRIASQSRESVLAALRGLLPLLDRQPLVGRLWIVEADGVRVRGGSD